MLVFFHTVCIHLFITGNGEEKNQFHASGYFCKTVLFCTCSAPPWAPHLEDCKLSLVSGRRETELGVLVPRGPARR